MSERTPAAVERTTIQLSRRGEPLVIKGVDRIEAIRVRRGGRRQVEVFTHTFSRLLRRDFNLTSVKFFYSVPDHRRIARVRHDLQALREETDVLENLARKYERPAVQAAASCAFRIVSRESEELLDILLAADHALLKLEHSELSEVAYENLQPFMDRYRILRRPLFRHAE